MEKSSPASYPNSGSSGASKTNGCSELSGYSGCSNAGGYSGSSGYGHNPQWQLDREEAVVSEIIKRLDNRLLAKRKFAQDEDDHIFEPHTSYFYSCVERKTCVKAAEIWRDKIEPAVKDIDKECQKVSPEFRIHKGAPYYNVGLSFFMVGDLDKAFQYISASGEEDEILGLRERWRVMIGDHPLSELLLIDPVIKWLDKHIEAKDLYRNITEVILSRSELKEILIWLARKHLDAVQAIIALQRLSRIDEGPQSKSTMHIRVQAIADLILVVESSIRGLQGSAGFEKKQLHQRMESLLHQNGLASSSFTSAHNRFCDEFRNKDKEAPEVLDWAFSDCLRHLQVSSTTDEKAGLACYLIVRTRNRLMHIIDESSALHDLNNQMKLIGITLSVIRLIKAAP